MNKQLTIVIPCKNEGHGVIDVLKFIKRQKVDCKIIVADSSTDDTINLLYNYKIHSTQVIQIISGGLPAVARNKGAKLVTTPYILFLDADVYLKNPNTIRHIVREIIANDCDLVTCRFKTIDGKFNWVYAIFNVIQWISSKTKPFAIGGFMLFKTETFNQLGGFDEQDKIAEDYHLSSKIKPGKFKIINDTVYTSSRRFKKKGVWYMIKLACISWLNRNNDKWFHQDYKYWE
jgi:glycosyltransferase involved in cell wall biosynthesis